MRRVNRSRSDTLVLHGFGHFKVGSQLGPGFKHLVDLVVSSSPVLQSQLCHEFSVKCFAVARPPLVITLALYFDPIASITTAGLLVGDKAKR